jgi:hypothetical protein
MKKWRGIYDTLVQGPKWRSEVASTTQLAGPKLHKFCPVKLNFQWRFWWNTHRTQVSQRPSISPRRRGSERAGSSSTVFCCFRLEQCEDLEGAVTVPTDSNYTFFLVSWGRVRQSPLGTSATIYSIVLAPDGRWWWVWRSQWNDNWKGKPKYLVHHKSHMI